MQPETPGRPFRATMPGIALYALLLSALSACATFGGPGGTVHKTGPDEAIVQPSALSAHLDAVQHLIQGQPSDQAALLAEAQKDFEVTPSPEHQLRYALLLAAPGHGGTNPGRAEQLLQPLASLPPGTLAPSEQALAIVELQDVQRALSLTADNQRLQDLAERNEHDRAVANTRRLQQEADENAKLRKDLEEARAKLDAIANIERGLTHPSP